MRVYTIKRKSIRGEATKINRPWSGKTKRKRGPKGARFVLEWILVREERPNEAEHYFT